MPPPFTTLITPTQLAQLGSEVLVVDCSHDLSDPEAGHRAWQQSHIPGAIHLHLERDLSGPCSGSNGRHPLPERATLGRRLAALGLRRGQQVVAYDRSQGPFAARLWWLLRWLGHSEVAVLDGGWQAWLDAGALPETTPPPQLQPGDFAPAAALNATVDIQAVLDNLAHRRLLLVDARSPQRYAGDGETLDPVGGHIPGAACRFYQHNLAADGRFKAASQLRQEWLDVLGDRAPATLVSQCGSGVTACHNLLALEHAGLPGAQLYPGSWSEWCADHRRPVARGPVPG